MFHSLQLFVAANASACVTIGSLVAGLSLAVLVYGRRHEQRTRERGSVL